MLHALRRRQLRIARAALGVFAATWLGLALQPCHAALAGTPPEAPPAATPAAMPCHGAEDVAPVPSGTDPGPCPYCGDGDRAACKLGTGVGCGAASAPVLELRDLSPQLPAAWPAVLMTPGWMPERLLLPPPSASPADPPPKVPAQERFCTHLE